MKSVTMAAALSALSLMAWGAAAQEVVPAPNATYSIDLDSHDSAISQWNINDLSGISAAHGVLKISRLGHDNVWPPAFSIKLEGGDQGAWLRFLSPDRKTVRAEALYQDGDSDSKIQSGELVPLNEPFEVDVDWTDSAVNFTVTVKGRPVQRLKVPMSARPTRLGVVSSTGQLEIDPLVLGTRP